MTTPIHLTWVNEDSLQIHLCEPQDCGRLSAGIARLRVLYGDNIRDLSAGFGQILVVLNHPICTDKLLGQLEGLSCTEVQSRTIEIPVCYDPEVALDLPEIADTLDMSMSEVIQRHCAQTLEVIAMGFAPGFGYLSGLDPLLHLPRKATPRTEIPPGSVAIAHHQSVIYPTATPGGWNIIGRTHASLIRYQPEPTPLFEIGDRVRFLACE